MSLLCPRFGTPFDNELPILKKQLNDLADHFKAKKDDIRLAKTQRYQVFLSKLEKLRVEEKVFSELRKAETALSDNPLLHDHHRSPIAPYLKEATTKLKLDESTKALVKYYHGSRKEPIKPVYGICANRELKEEIEGTYQSMKIFIRRAIPQMSSKARVSLKL